MMALPDTLETFLSPISDQNPVGESMRYSNEYDAIREAMRSEDPDLPLGIWMTDIKVADWRETASLCCNILQHQSKDLQVAAWLIEAWIHLYNTAGLAKGFALFHQLAQTYWETIYPVIPEDGDIDFRIAPYIWINDKLSARIQHIEVTEPQDVGDQPYTFFDWIEVSRLKDLYPVGDRKYNNAIEQVGASKKPSLLDFDTNLLKTPTPFLQNLLKDIEDTLTQCTEIEAFLDDKIKDNPPSLYSVRNVLNDIKLFLTQTLQTRGVAEKPSQNAADTAPSNAAQNTEPPGEEAPSKASYVTVKGVPMSFTPQNTNAATGASETETTASPEPSQTQPMTRDLAYQQINEAATYLAKIEPHSPVPYLIQRAVSWRNKSFMEVMKEMVSDPNGVADINKLLGFPASTPAPKNDSSSQEE